MVRTRAGTAAHTHTPNTPGGFFASGFKRAFKMKDFGSTIPGHGGVTDRFDCQMIMAMFAYLYYWNYVAAPEFSVGQALEVCGGLHGVSCVGWIAVRTCTSVRHHLPFTRLSGCCCCCVLHRWR
jgi:hypothetical protein